MIVARFPALSVAISGKSVGADWLGLEHIAGHPLPANSTHWSSSDTCAFPLLRKVEVRILTPPGITALPAHLLYFHHQPLPAAGDRLEMQLPAGRFQPAASDYASRQRKLAWTLSTNLIYDALLIPSVAASLMVSPDICLGISWMYGWKERRASRPFYAYGGDIHARYYLSRSPHLFSGQHIGLKLQMMRYNHFSDNRGYVADKWTSGGGFEYGYSFRLAKRLRIDTSITIGYLSGKYRKYERNDGCDVWQYTRRVNWFGPTSAEISLAWVFGPSGKEVHP